MLNHESAENIAFKMPWQLFEDLYKSEAAGNTAAIASIGLCAIAF